MKQVNPQPSAFFVRLQRRASGALLAKVWETREREPKAWVYAGPFTVHLLARELGLRFHRRARRRKKAARARCGRRR
jgi:hypothetical protein